MSLDTNTSPMLHSDPQSESAKAYIHARAVMPGGISHRYRFRKPNPIYVSKAQGSHKWDADGNRYVDFKMGAASQMMGHCHPALVDALQSQAARAFFAADCNLTEIEWADRICKLVPSADQVRFCASGTEATMLAIRVARAFTRRDHILRVDGHYHGWHDLLMSGAKIGSDAPPTLGVPQPIADLTHVIAPDPTAIREALSGEAKYACVIVEASGANYGAVPMHEDVLKAVREATSKVGSLMIMDEIITGFRWSPGGQQALADVSPDLTTLAKIVTGGLPGGALVGSQAVMDMLNPEITTGGFTPGVLHQGTFNGAPIIAAPAVAMMDLLADGSAQAHADGIATAIRKGVNDLFDKHGIAGICYGESSTFHLYFGEVSNGIAAVPGTAIRSPNPALVSTLQNTLNANGVDFMSALSAVTSAVHTDDDVEETLAAFSHVFDALKEQRLV